MCFNGIIKVLKWTFILSSPVLRQSITCRDNMTTPLQQRDKNTCLKFGFLSVCSTFPRPPPHLIQEYHETPTCPGAKKQSLGYRNTNVVLTKLDVYLE